MNERFKFLVLARAGRFAVVREMESGEVAGYVPVCHRIVAGHLATLHLTHNRESAGYDPVADRNDEQRHFKIHRGPAAYDAAFGDSRQYQSMSAAIADAEASGREVRA